MLAVIKEKQVTEEQADQLELEALAPEKFNPDLQFKINKHASNVQKEMKYKILTREETAELIYASNAPYDTPSLPSSNKSYPTYTREQAEAMVREHCEYNDEQKQRDKWDSQKTIELGPKISTKMTPSKSTKD